MTNCKIYYLGDEKILEDLRSDFKFKENRKPEKKNNKLNTGKSMDDSKSCNRNCCNLPYTLMWLKPILRYEGKVDLCIVHVLDTSRESTENEKQGWRGMNLAFAKTEQQMTSRPKQKCLPGKTATSGQSLTGHSLQRQPLWLPVVQRAWGTDVSNLFSSIQLIEQRGQQPKRTWRSNYYTVWKSKCERYYKHCHRDLAVQETDSLAVRQNSPL